MDESSGAGKTPAGTLARVNAEGYRAVSQEQWGLSAKTWAKAVEEPDSGASAAAAEWMLATAGLVSGERVLELACGAGRVGLQAAELVGPDGSVVCSDFAAPMVDAVRERAQRLALANVQARVLDAERLELEPGEAFHAVLCRFGYMLMSDPERALTETARALLPGGRVVLAVWGDAASNPWLTTIFNAVMDHFGAPPPEPGTPGPFALADERRLASLLEQVGLANVSIEKLEAEQPYESLEAWWERIRTVSGPLATALDAVSEADRATIRGRALAGAGAYERDDGSVVFPAAVIGAKATRPE